MRGVEKGISFLWFIIFLGAVCGSLIGDILGSSLSILNFLKDSYAIGTSTPIILNLKVMVLTLGLNFNINIMTIIGIIVAIILYRRY
ncbi:MULTISPECIES: DUF4321 domain-containing protein [Clostridium]|uniref:DUF4321 domain-containing protein n=1 Tax=Clostridium tanneri TaxID=3037988 RepID=A0ABU4JP26_9CLOT|nr:DUF4321 domain-containing protein [Clostridium sp. A1-XYC3]MDW8799870.1 DUF4321 domain-containing protein [Clostridium sp. A1-XYC3]